MLIELELRKEGMANAEDEEVYSMPFSGAKDPIFRHVFQAFHVRQKLKFSTGKTRSKRGLLFA